MRIVEVDAGRAAELRALARREPNAPARVRLLGVANVLGGLAIEPAAQAVGAGRATLDGWLGRYRAEGVDGLDGLARPTRGRPAAAAHAGAGRRVQGPDRGRAGPRQGRGDGGPRRRPAPDPRGGVRGRGRAVQRLPAGAPAGLAPGRAAAAAPEGRPGGAGRLPANLPARAREACAGPAPGTPVEVRCRDELRLGQKGTVRRVRAARGTRPRVPRAMGFEPTSLSGAACPGRGAGAGLVPPAATAEAMAPHLAGISARVAPGAHAVVVLAGAGYHRAGAPAGRVPANLSLLPLPPYSPELNPMELAWPDLRRRDLGNRVSDDPGAVVDACCAAWNNLVAEPGRLASLTDFARARSTPKTS